MKKINVEVQCLCNKSRQIRGIEYQTLELLSALAKRGKNRYSASFFDYMKERCNRGLLEDYFASYGVLDLLDLKECNSLDYREVIRAWDTDTIPSYAAKDYDDYVHAEADVYYFPHTVTLPANLPYGKTVVTICDILHLKNEQARKYHPEAANQIERIIKYVAGREDIFIAAISDATKRDLIEYVGIDEARIDTVHLAYNSRLFYPEDNNETLSKMGITKPYILYLGGLDAHKGIDVLCDAFDHMPEKNLQLVLAGGRCAWYDVDSVVSIMNRRNDVVLPGYVTDEQKRVLMSMADVFVFPSYYEGFGLPVIEAMACGAPVVATNVTSIPEVGGEAAEYFNAGDSNALRNILDEIINDDAKRSCLKKKSLSRAKDFSWEITAQNMERVFDNYADNKKSN